MAANIQVPPFSLVIDTDSYAGNFERELCAYVTGEEGDCGVVCENFESIQEELDKWEIRDIIMKVSDDRGCARPCYIAQSPNFKYNSVEIFFEDEPTPELISLFKERTLQAAQDSKTLLSKYCEGFKVLGFRTIKRVLTETVESI